MNSKNVAYVIKRILLAILTIWIVITLTFFAMHAIPGGPFLSERAITDSVLTALQAKYGLDKPLFIQYLNYLKGALTFDFGPSIKIRGQNVNTLIWTRFQVSMKIGGVAALLAILFGVVLGSLAEADIYQRFNELVKDKTAIFISHRLSSSVFCDRVLLLEDGHIVDFDTHAHLMKKKESLYYKMFTTQAKNYRLD